MRLEPLIVVVIVGSGAAAAVAEEVMWCKENINVLEVQQTSPKHSEFRFVQLKIQPDKSELGDCNSHA